MRWPSHAQTKASSVEWIGEVPAHWHVKRLRFALCGIEQGWSPLCDNTPADDDEWGVLKAGCVNGSALDESENKRLPETLGPAREYEIRAGDVLMSRANTTDLLGSAVHVGHVRPKLLLCDKLYRLRYDRGTVHPVFLVYALRSHAGRAELEREATGTSGSMQNIGQRVVQDARLPFPPFDEQHAIAAFLDRETARIDALVAAKRRLIALLHEKRAALIARAVTRGLDPDVPTKDSGVAWLGRVPAHWHVTPLKRVTSLIRSGKTPLGGATVYEDEGVPFLRSQNVHFSGLELSDVAFIDIDTHRSMSSSSVLPHDVLLNITGASVGRVCVVPASLQHANVNQHVCIIRLKRDVALSEFVATVLQSSGIQAQIRADETGSSREGLTFSQIGDFAIALPPVEEQRTVVKSMSRKLARLAQSTEIAEQTMQRLTEYRSALITSAVTGHIDVRTSTP